jgi:hypothetical protein
MFSKKNRVEFIKDGFSLKRRSDFAKLKKIRNFSSLDGYISFLMSVQKISPFAVSKDKTISSFNKL